MTGGLSCVLAYIDALYLTTYNFYCKVTGPIFDTLLTMFMTEYA